MSFAPAAFAVSCFKRIRRFFDGFFYIVGVSATLAAAFCLYRMAAGSKTSFEQGTVLRLGVEDALYETRPDDFIGSLTFGNPPTVWDVVSGLNRAADDPAVSGLVAYMTQMPLTVAQTQEIRTAVKRFKKAGKKTVFFAPTIGELGGGLSMYYLASAFDEIRIQPGGEVGVAGIAVETPYFKKALEKIGIKPSFSARHEYKTGADSLSAEKMSDAERENLTAVFNDFLDVMAADIAADRPFAAPAQVRKILTSGPYFAQRALEMKLIDKVEYADVLERELKERDADIVDLFDYTAATYPEIGKKTPVVALIPAVGIIQSGPSVFGGDAYRSILGFSTFSEQLRDAADDETVKAIVIRLDSPGGGYTPSDAMRREIEYVKTVSQKPVVCSMAGTAASGGYFASLGCDRVFAVPATLTGSIGVFGGKLVFKDLLKKLDVSVGLIQTGENASMFSAARDFTPSQRKYFNESLDRVYSDFTAKVADRRGFTPAETDAVARGRVFTGARAKANRLIDETGGLADAVAAAVQMAGLPENTPVVEYPAVPSRIEMLLGLLDSNTAVSLRKGFAPSVKMYVKRLTQGDFRLFYSGLPAF